MSAIVDRSWLVWTHPQDLRGQVAIVIGGSSGIGLAVARALDERGVRVVVASRDAARVEQAVRSLDHATGFANCDTQIPDRVDSLFKFAQGLTGQIDMLIYSAGIGRGDRTLAAIPRPVASLDEDEWDAVIDTNLRGAFLACRAAARIMVAQGHGQILNISSARGAVRGQACGSGYCASKMAVRAMFQAMSEELAPLGVRVLSLLPDAVDTSLIAGTTLAPRGALDSIDVGRFVAQMLSAPFDTLLDEPVVAPFNTRGRAGGRKQPSTASGADVNSHATN